MSKVVNPTSIFIDLDNTLYDYGKVESIARRELLIKASRDLKISKQSLSKSYEEARIQVKLRNNDLASSHSRLCYIAEMFVILGLRQKPAQILEFENIYWQSYLSEIKLDPGVSDFISLIRQRTIPIVLITDLTTEIQYRKLIRLNLHSSFDYIITSEECGREKSSGIPFKLGFSRLSEKQLESPWFIGDSIHDDGGMHLDSQSTFFLRTKYAKFVSGINKSRTITFREFRQIIKFLN